MHFVETIRGRIDRLLVSPGEEWGRWTRFLGFHVRLWRFCARRLWEHNVAALSAALSFRTIFAMIPALVLAVLVLKSVGVLEDGKQSLREVLATSGFAQIAVVEEAAAETAAAEEASGKVVNVADEIEAAVARVEAKLTFGRVGPIGVLVLIWTALTLLSTMERSLNRVFEATRPRPLLRRLLLYWSALTLGPLILITAKYIGESTTRAFADIAWLSWLFTILGRVQPVVAGILLVAAVYKLLPNTHIRYRAAIGGALVSVPLWTVAKWAFALYVTEIVAKGNLYGAIGLLPLFLLWVNLSWSIFLFGAELAHTAANLRGMTIAEEAQTREATPADLLAAAVIVARPYLAAKGPVLLSEIADRLHVPQPLASTLLDRLETAGVVCRTESDGETAYVLARPASAVPVLQVVGMDQSPGSGAGRGGACAADVSEAVTRAWASARSAWGGFTLAEAADCLDRAARPDEAEPARPPA